MDEKKKLKIVAITGCAAGIAHTYMAAENIEQHFSSLGHKIRVEKHGTAGPEDVLTAKEIREADYVLIAAEIAVNKDRFVGKMLYATDTHKAMINPGELLEDLKANASKYKQSLGKTKSGDAEIQQGEKKREKKSYVAKHIMYAMGWMIPLVIAAGITMAIGNMFSTELVWNPNNGAYDALWGFTGKPVAGALFDIGAAGMSLIYPVIGAGIAYSIAGKLAFAPAFIGGWLMNQGGFLGIENSQGNAMGTGFLGAIVAGLFVGYLIHFAKKIRWNKNLKGIANLMIVPLLGTMITGLMAKYALAPAIAPIVIGLENGLNFLDKNLGQSGAILIGAIIGAMITSDLGGPINKTALMFGTAIWMASVEAAPGRPDLWNFVPGTASQAAIGVPPLMAFLATTIFPGRFTTQQKNLGMNAGVMSLFGISEGAIPFAAVKPLIFIPANIVAGAMAGILVSAVDFQFYGGLGSPLGAIFGYIPLGSGAPYYVSMILWFVLVMVSALVGTGLIYLGFLLTDRNNVYRVNKNEAKDKYLDIKQELKSKYPSPADSEKLKQEIAIAKEKYKSLLPQMKIDGRAKYKELLSQKTEGKKAERQSWKESKSLLNQRLKEAKLTNEDINIEQLDIQISEIHEQYKLDRKAILKSKEIPLFEKYDKIKETFEEKIDLQREIASNIPEIKVKAEIKAAKQEHKLALSKYDELVRF